MVINGCARGMPKTKPRLSQESAEAAFWRSGGVCAVCHGRATSHHHIFPQTKYPELADEPDNLVSLCANCHLNHHSWAKRIPRNLVKDAEHLAKTGSQQRFLEKNYPNTAKPAKLDGQRRKS